MLSLERKPWLNKMSKTDKNNKNNINEEELDTEKVDEVKDEEKTAENEAENADTQVNDEVSAAQKKADEYLLAAQRIQADFENYKRRNKNAIADATEDGVNETLKQFLPVLDNVDRAVDAAKQFGDESFTKGIELLQRQVKDVFEKLDVCEIEVANGFDPNFHNAVMQEEAGEGVEENTIVDVFQKGYMRKGKVLRFSMVKVAK